MACSSSLLSSTAHLRLEASLAEVAVPFLHPGANGLQGFIAGGGEEALEGGHQSQPVESRRPAGYSAAGCGKQADEGGSSAGQ